MTPNQLRTTLARLGLSQRGAARLLGIDERALRGLAQREQDQDANSAACRLPKSWP